MIGLLGGWMLGSIKAYLLRPQEEEYALQSAAVSPTVASVYLSHQLSVHRNLALDYLM